MRLLEEMNITEITTIVAEDSSGPFGWANGQSVKLLVGWKHIDVNVEYILYGRNKRNIAVLKFDSEHIWAEISKLVAPEKFAIALSCILSPS